MDVRVIRQLQLSRHALWATESSRSPDLGEGGSSGGSALMARSLFSDPLQEPTVNNPGFYRGICIELDVFGLCVCAILGSGLLDTEGMTAGTGASAAGNASGFTLKQATVDNVAGGDGDDVGTATAATTTATADHFASSDSSPSRGFNVFKALVAKVMNQVRSGVDQAARQQQGGDKAHTIHMQMELAESLLMSVYRYLCGYGNGLLSDPALHGVVFGLMGKLFKRLIGGLRRLGTEIIYADFNKIIVCTNKYVSELVVAAGYVVVLSAC